MPLIDDILRCRSVAIVGMAKNAGKTECLNYILSQARERCNSLAITSIGIDGESVDQVSGTAKPEITLYPGMLFVTSEKHYAGRRLTSEILSLSDMHTSLGRLVTARTKIAGKVILSGPADTATLRRLLDRMRDDGVQTTLVDGALSRLSLSSPAVTDALVLATGAALSPNIGRIVSATRYVYDLISLPEVDEPLRSALAAIETGVHAVDDCGGIHDLRLRSALMLASARDRIFSFGTTLFVAGAVSDKMLAFLRQQRNAADITLVIRDFTRMFAEAPTYYGFIRKGGKIRVLQRSRLLAVSVNPWSPSGYTVDGTRLCQEMQQALGVPVYDVRQEQQMNK